MECEMMANINYDIFKETDWLQHIAIICKYNFMLFLEYLPYRKYNT